MNKLVKRHQAEALKLINKVQRNMIIFIHLIVYFVIHIVPRNNQTFVFGSEGGATAGFADNSKYLFLYISQHTDSKAVWISSNSNLIMSLNENGYNAYPTFSLPGLYYILTCGKLIKTQSLFEGDIPWMLAGGASVIQLYHGVPLKKISIGPNPSSWIRSKVSNYLFSWDLFAITSQDLGKDLFLKAGVRSDTMVSTGYPRNDALHREIPDEDVFCSQYLERISNGSLGELVVTYLPTFRPYDIGELEEILQPCLLNKLLKDNDANLYIKGHANSKFSTDIEASNIFTLDPAIDIYPLLRHTDILVTDYSSVAFDYLLLNRPIIYYTFDLDKYQTNRGFQADFESLTPGPKTSTPSELRQQLKSIFNGNDKYFDERMSLRSQIHTSSDGKYSQRVYKEIVNLDP